MADLPPLSPLLPLQKPVITDNSVLSNFVDAGLARLLFGIVGGPIYIPPSILDPMELPPYSNPPMAEFAKGVFKAQSKPNDTRMARRHFHRVNFIRQQGVLWQPAGLNLRISQRRLEIEQMSAKLTPQDAESLAFAELNCWILFTDDSLLAQVAEDLGVKVFRTCGLLKLAVKNDLIECSTAADSFNRVMVEEMGFYVLRKGQTERLYLKCSPPRCEWRMT